MSTLDDLLQHVRHMPLPLAPTIDDKVFHKAVFTHRSYRGLPAWKDCRLAEEGRELKDNEKAEHVGDALLNCSITMLLHADFRTLSPGGATTLRSLLVRNETLEVLSMRYGFDKKLRTATHVGAISIRDKPKIRANIFKAYIGGLFWYYEKYKGEGDAFLRVSTWLRAIYGPLARWTYSTILAPQHLDDSDVFSSDSEGSEIEDRIEELGARIDEISLVGERSVSGALSGGSLEIARSGQSQRDDIIFDRAQHLTVIPTNTRSVVEFLRAGQNQLSPHEIRVEMRQDNQILQGAAGATQLLNRHVTGVWFCPNPTYSREALAEQIWKATCTVNGRTPNRQQTASAIASSIKDGKTVAAWKVCRVFGLQ